MKANFNIDKLITVDNTGMPCAPNIRQLLDKDVLEVYRRDKTSDKSMYIKEMGVVYYLGDPKSPAKQQGLSDKEALKLAIENFDLPSDYSYDEVITRLIKKYYRSNITEAGIALESLQKSIHLVSLAAVKINNLLNEQLNNAIEKDDVASILTLMDNVNKRINDIPNMTKALNAAYENLQNEEENITARGGKAVLSSMDADEE